MVVEVVVSTKNTDAMNKLVHLSWCVCKGFSRVYIIIINNQKVKGTEQSE